MKKQSLRVIVMLMVFTLIPVFYSSATIHAATTNKPMSNQSPSAPEPIDIEEDTYSDHEVAPELQQAFDDYVDYYSQYKEWVPYETKAVSILNKYKKVLASTRKQAYSEMTNIAIPNYKKFLSGMKQLKPNNNDLSTIHSKLIKGTTLQLEGMILFQKYVSKLNPDPTIIKKANVKFTQGQLLISEFNEEIALYNAPFSQ
ncbi:hypothetical protein PO903_08120 [Paenibacillus sp. PK4536]|uniref:hypothetical protein n=1 Tax=Paenibacillus sp. PK4536 TaxID=3024576 RepID=UPI0023586AEE|nr:hypothetical protein [Paenibacillus sp. PK4536]WIM40829.1 hypothetical protein PO903_08120 [Paenibacillus sp. PK4536]